MIRKLRVWLMALAVVLSGMVALQREVAQADCQITGTSGDDDVVACTNPADADGIATGNGNDTITVETGTEVNTVSNITAIDSGYGDDKVYQYGTVTSPSATDTIDLRGGNDLVENYGTLDSGDDGIWCAPATGNTCTIRNFGTVDAVNEAIDVYGKGGQVVVNNSGTIYSLLQEGMHLLSEVNTLYMVTNSGTIDARHNGVEVGWGRLSMHNSGTIISRSEVGVKTGGQPDWLDNSGAIQTSGDPTVEFGPGPDTLINSGTISAASTTSEYESAVAMESGNDEVINTGNITITGKGLYGIEGGLGSDTITIRGGNIDKLIFGDDFDGSNGTDYDILVFEFTGSTSAIDSFRNEVNTQTPQSGSATWNGITYRWGGFEEIRLVLTSNGGGPTSTPLPTNTPQPTSTGQPTSTAQPTNTPKPTNTPQPTSTSTTPPPSNTVLENGSFEAATSYLPDGWTGKQLTLNANVDGQDCAQHSGGSCSMRLMGDGNSSKLIQDLNITGAQGDSYLLTFDTMTNNVSGSGSAKVMVKVYYTDGSKQTFKVKLPSGTNAWKSYQLPFTTTRSYTKIQVIIQFTMSSGFAWFDTFTLTEQ